MDFEQFYLGCLAQASYLIGSDGEAAVVDPRRDVDVYIEAAKAQGLRIRHVIETHLHADFVSGHRELAAKTGAKIYFGARAKAAFPHVPVRDGDEIRIGKRHAPVSRDARPHARVRLRRRHGPVAGPRRPGGRADRRHALHRRRRAAGPPRRPDERRGARGQLYDSLHGKLLTLPDSVKVYPAHGAGSLCGRNISSETSSTIGEQRRFN